MESTGVTVECPQGREKNKTTRIKEEEEEQNDGGQKKKKRKGPDGFSMTDRCILDVFFMLLFSSISSISE